MPMSGTISNVQCTLQGQGSALTSGSYTITLMKNTVATGVTCGPMTASQAVSASAVVAGSGTVSFNAGDILAWKSVPTSPSSSQSPLAGAEFTDASPIGNEAPMCTTTGNGAETFTDFYWNGSGAGQTTDTKASFKFAAAGTIDNLYVNRSNTTAGIGTYTIYHNGSSTSLVASTVAGSYKAHDTDPTHAITIALGDTMSVVPTNGGGTTAAQSTVCVRWRPTTPGQYVLGGTMISGFNAASKRGTLGGGSPGNGNTTGSMIALPFAYGAGWCPTSCMTFSNFFVSATSAPTSLTLITTDYTDATGSANLTQNITTTNGTTDAGTPSLCSCSVTVTNSASSTTWKATDLLEINASVQSGTVSNNKWGMVVTVP